KLNQAKGPVTFLIPTRGWSTADAPDSPAYDPAEDQAFTDTLRQKCRPEITIQTVKVYLNDTAFAEVVVKALTGLLQG
ncbi:MAG: Tm-1-like ATP-binding domain-containing protein, partial [Desulfobacterota bacterium]|nr:Tm-1-like ATP-binding domain-containing protein [Thermodesulfobacteriota bacterium]